MVNNTLKFVFFGTPDFAVIILKTLKKAELMPSLIVTMPDRPRGRGQKIQPSPVKIWAGNNQIPVRAPENPNGERFLEELRKTRASAFVVAAYGNILKKALFDAPPRGTVNVHPSLLPKYRGATPIQGALLAGETETGVTLMLIDEKLDHGQVIAQARVGITPDDDSITLTQKLAARGGVLLVKTLPSWIAGKITPTPQNSKNATFTKPLTKQDGLIDWNMPAKKITRHIRAYQIWPTSWTILYETNNTECGTPKPKRVKIFKAEETNEPTNGAKPGTIREKNGDLLVAANDTFLKITMLQTEGRRTVAGADFLKKHAVRAFGT